MLTKFKIARGRRLRRGEFFAGCEGKVFWPHWGGARANCERSGSGSVGLGKRKGRGEIPQGGGI